MTIHRTALAAAALLALALTSPTTVAANEPDLAVELLKIQAGMRPSMISVPRGQYTLRPGGSRSFTFLPSQSMAIRTSFEVTWNTDFLGGGGLNPVELVVRLRNADGRVVRTVRARSPLRLNHTIARQSDNRRWTLEVVNPHNPIPGVENLRVSVGGRVP